MPLQVHEIKLKNKTKNYIWGLNEKEHRHVYGFGLFVPPPPPPLAGDFLREKLCQQISISSPLIYIPGGILFRREHFWE